MKWLGGLDGVERAELVPYSDESDERLIRLVLVKDIPDREVAALIDTVKQKFPQYDEGYDGSIELAIDGFHARFHPSNRMTREVDREVDVERALWLRRDGRATSSVYGSSGFKVTAAPAAVAAVALGFDRIAPDEGGRRTHRVESADRQVVVEWTHCPPLGFRLNRRAAQRFADLQAKYPHLTGWIDEPEHRAAVYFAAADVDLDVLLGSLPKLVDGVFGKLELGWGPARAPQALFGKAFSPRIRELLGHLMTIPGGAEVTIVDYHGTAEPGWVTVRDRAGYVAALATLRKVWDSYLQIRLVRTPSKYVGMQRNPVFETHSFDDQRQFAIYSTLADLTGVARVDVGPEFSNLVVAKGIVDEQLATTLEVMAKLPAVHRIVLYVSDGPDDSGVKSIGRVVNRKFVPEPSKGVDPGLVTRVRAAWERAAR
jgi:hypothetical protein